MANYTFVYQKRLGIKLPYLEKGWEEYSIAEQYEILATWEIIRGRIPDRIKQIEQQINRKQQALYDEENFIESCRLNSEIADLASAINDLQIWFRVQQEVNGKRHL